MSPLISSKQGTLQNIGCSHKDYWKYQPITIIRSIYTIKSNKRYRSFLVNIMSITDFIIVNEKEVKVRRYRKKH